MSARSERRMSWKRSILSVTAAGSARLPALLRRVSTTLRQRQTTVKLTYSIVLAESDEPEAYRDHAGMDRERHGLERVLELRSGAFGQASRHEEGERARAQRIPRGVRLDHRIAFVELDAAYETRADAVRDVVGVVERNMGWPEKRSGRA